MSDSHDNWEILQKAVELANQNSCDLLMFAGDLVSPFGIDCLSKFNGKVIFVFGNNEAERVKIIKKIDEHANIEFADGFYDGSIGGVRLFMSHFPKYSELAFKSKEYELCVCGHTHSLNIEQKEGKFFINPGELHGYVSGKSTSVIFDSNTLETKILEIKIQE